MKSFITLSLAALAAAATLSRRQAIPGLGKDIKFAGESKLEPEVNKKAVRVLQKFGPITLNGRGSSADSGQQDLRFRMPNDAFCKGCTVLKGRIALMNLDGTPGMPKNGSGVYIHHILTTSSKRASSFISSSTGCKPMLEMTGSKFVGSGEDNNNVDVWYTRKDGSHLGGFHINAGDRFGMEADIVSLNVAKSEIYITMDMEYLPGIVGGDTRETLLDVSWCGGERVKAPANGQGRAKSASWKFLEPGTITIAKGHLHAGGDKVQVYINNKLACESKASYDGSKGGGAITGMSLCPLLPVKAGDSLYFTALYDATQHPLRHETHGMGGGMADIMGMLDIVFTK